MSTLTRKQREMREREARILELARPMLLEGGYHGLSMDRIAQDLEYAKGTIYNHFACKEEIILALAIQAQEKRYELFERAASFRGRPRVRMAGVGLAAELFVCLYPEYFQVEHILRSSSVWEKTSEQRKAVQRACETRCVGVVGGIVRDGVAQGDLSLPSPIHAEDIVFGLWSMTYGAFSILTTTDSLPGLGIADPFAAYRLNTARLLDGYGWRPLSAEHDCEAALRTIQKKVFPDVPRKPLPR